MPAASPRPMYCWIRAASQPLFILLMPVRAVFSLTCSWSGALPRKEALSEDSAVFCGAGDLGGIRVRPDTVWGTRRPGGGARGEGRLVLSPVECTYFRDAQNRRRAQEDRWTEQGEGGRGQGFPDAPALAWPVPSCPLYTHHSWSSKRDDLRD